MPIAKEDELDHYETLQVSPNADTDTIQRVFRLLAQRFHPDNQETGSDERFRAIHKAYEVLSDSERRAQYDIRHEAFRRERWRFVATGPPKASDFNLEQHVRYTVLEILYSRRRGDPDHPGISQLELVRLTGQPREHLEFTIWYLVQKKLLSRDDQSNLTISVEGIDFVEQFHPTVPHRLRLTEAR